jgi:peptide/nickel transport system permease protein
MRRYFTVKVLESLVTLAFVLVFNFFLFRVLPGDPVALLLRGGQADLSPQVIAQQRHELGLDKSLPAQFLTYLSNTAHGEFGVALRNGQPVWPQVVERVPNTLLLVGTATIASTILGVLLGIWAGWRRGSTVDVVSTNVTLFFYAMPEFWFGLVLLMIFAGLIPILPTGGYSTQGADLSGIAHWGDVLNHMVLPFFTLTVAYLGEYSLIMRSSLIDTLGDEYIQTARAKGLREKFVLRRHAVPNALLPTMTLTLLSLGFVVSGAITIELIFSWPGLGLLTFESVESNDYPMLQALFLVFSAAVIVANLVADLLLAYLDPRVRVAGQR